MKISFILKDGLSLTGGVRVVAIYADKLARRGHEVSVVALARQKPALRHQLRSILAGRGLIRVTPEPHSHFDDKLVQCRFVTHPPPITDADLPDADIVIATWWETAEWVARLSPRKGAKVYFVQGHEVYDHLPAARVKATYRLPFQKLTVSRWLHELMATEYGDTTAELLPNGVDLLQFHQQARTKQPVPTVGTLYSRKHIKGYDVALAAYRLATRELPALQLVTFGGDPPGDDAPIPESARFFYQPAQNQLKQIYGSCDAWLHCSRVDGFGLPILEAMACRTPVIATATGAAPELLQGGGGVTVPCDDPHAIAKHIVAVNRLSDAAWNSLSDQAYATAKSYSWDSATRRLESLLQRIVAEAPRQHADAGLRLAQSIGS